MTQEELELILSSGSIDERIAELLREQIMAEEAETATRDQPAGQMVGRVFVPNVAGPIAGIFERGRQQKKARTAKEERAKEVARREEAARTMVEGVLGRNLEAVTPSVPRIGAPPAVDTAAQDAVLARPAPRPPGDPRAQALPPGVVPPLPDREPRMPSGLPMPSGPQAPAQAPSREPLPEVPSGPVDPELLIRLLLGGASRRDQLPGEGQAPLFPGSPY